MLDNLVHYGKEFDIKSTWGTRNHENITKEGISQKPTDHFIDAMQKGNYKRSARVLKTFKKTFQKETGELILPKKISGEIEQCNNPKAKAKLQDIITPRDKNHPAQSIQQALESQPGANTRQVSSFKSRTNPKDRGSQSIV